ncbi:DUF2274 domain-containing protein [Mesorhizobium sp.]|uniref:DUF2274 domain-containing protein n=1 Tax=Mesorhizobium sp. TaxID=1871066 RepID=UPI00122AAD69|nr:DUF2274 domain-containing protein [Mesorhizobium sp.]TIS88416.1 MAG: DUF2274 domain-containing protein [Mesorhizobium sp.]
MKRNNHGQPKTRTLSKITINVSASLNQALQDYATLYRQADAESESVAELIPFMLAEAEERYYAMLDEPAMAA